MSEGHGGGGDRQKPTDDRTLLDPLNEDELKALREARQRMQAKKAAKAAKKPAYKGAPRQTASSKEDWIELPAAGGGPMLEGP